MFILLLIHVCLAIYEGCEWLGCTQSISSVIYLLLQVHGIINKLREDFGPNAYNVSSRKGGRKDVV